MNISNKKILAVAHYLFHILFIPFRLYYKSFKMLVDFQKDHRVASTIFFPMLSVYTTMLLPLILDDWIPYDQTFSVLLIIFVPYAIVFLIHGLILLRQ